MVGVQSTEMGTRRSEVESKVESTVRKASKVNLSKTYHGRRVWQGEAFNTLFHCFKDTTISRTRKAKAS